MTKQQIYTINIQLQSTIQEIIYACHIQNYDKVVRTFTDMTEHLMKVLEEVFADVSYYNQEMEIVNPEGINASLQGILNAQENKDYILLADLLELQLLPFIQSLQEVIRFYDFPQINPEIWEKNMKVLQQKNTELWEKLTIYHDLYEKENLDGTWKGNHHLEDTNAGAFTLAGTDQVGTYYYHSNVNPMKEAKTFARYYYNINNENYLIWGLGLGYHIKALFELDDGINVSVYESDLDVLYHCMMVQDFSFYISSQKLSIIYDPNFTKIIYKLNQIRENLILHYPSLRHISNEKIREQMEMFFIRDSGKRNAEILFESNSRENFRNFDGYVDELKTEFNDKKVVIVAAGPSLDKNVNLLKDKPNNTIILATGTVFYKLLKLGIDVDYVIVTDANSRVYSQISGLEDKKIPMLYLSTAYKGFSKYYQGKKYLICQSGYDKAEIIAKENNWSLYETGGSVSTTALDICIQFGCSKIAFIGLDLGYTNNLAHAEGTSKRDAGELENLRTVPAIGGGTVPVTNLFMIYNKWIENRIKQKDVTMPVIDATEGGAIIPGIQNMILKEYLDSCKIY